MGIETSSQKQQTVQVAASSPPSEEVEVTLVVSGNPFTRRFVANVGPSHTTGAPTPMEAWVLSHVRYDFFGHLPEPSTVWDPNADGAAVLVQRVSLSSTSYVYVVLSVVSTTATVCVYEAARRHGAILRASDDDLSSYVRNRLLLEKAARKVGLIQNVLTQTKRIRYMHGGIPEQWNNQGDSSGMQGRFNTAGLGERVAR